MPLILIVSIALIGCGDKKSGRATPPAPPTPGVPPGGDTSTNFIWSGNLQVQDGNLYEEYLEDNNVCNPIQWGWKFGSWDCSNYNGMGVSLHMTTTTIPSYGFVIMYSRYQGYVSQTYINGNFLPFDNNIGFELLRRGYDGSYGWNAQIRYRFYGDPASGNLALEAYYRGALMATAQLSRNQ